jgi:4-alpha-glucanotransferase
MTMRASGVLLAISSLPSAYGIGAFDQAAYEFIDGLAAAGQTVWQILPLGPTGYGDSPYQSFSTFAGNPYFISLDELVKQGLLTQAECEAPQWGADPRRVDYGTLYTQRFPLLRLAHSRSRVEETAEYEKFCREESDWLPDYALFMAIKNAQGGKSWQDWPKALRLRQPEALERARQDYSEDVSFYIFLQFLFYQQWNKLLSYAHSKGISIFGDIPIYVALDSADAWANPELFQLDSDNRPVAVSGCPPDAFAPEGQVWGNPLYRWEEHEKTGYAWWVRRVKFSFRIYDMLRIDHFRGFDEYFAIPAGESTAQNGWWEKGPGLALFQAIRGELGDREIVAEDLGYVTDTVRKLVRDTGFANMKVFEFAFDSRDTGAASDYLPHNYAPNSVAYTGTHDNATVLSWLDEITPQELADVQGYLATDKTGSELVDPIISGVLRSVSKLAVIPIQDYLGYGEEARMNKPSTNGTNWQWRLLPGEFSPALQEKIRRMTRRYGRI